MTINLFGYATPFSRRYNFHIIIIIMPTNKPKNDPKNADF
jgi:hypothetical protein